MGLIIILGVRRIVEMIKRSNKKEHSKLVMMMTNIINSSTMHKEGYVFTMHSLVVPMAFYNVITAKTKHC